MFTDDVELYVAPKKGKAHVLRLIRDILYFKPKNKGTHVTNALRYLMNVLHRKSILFVISDFLNDLPKQTLTLANKYHDVIAITLNDQREEELPKSVIMMFQDPETGSSVLVDTSKQSVRERFKIKAQERTNERNRLFDSLSIDHIDVYTHQGYVDALVRFFKQRHLKAVY
jgi:uncharacterized protein (DUF58 family)